jgi:hypothetical protein
MAVSIQIAKFKPILMESHFAKFQGQCYPLYGGGAPVIAAALALDGRNPALLITCPRYSTSNRRNGHTLSSEFHASFFQPPHILPELCGCSSLSLPYHENVIYVHVDAYSWKVLQLVYWNKAGAEAIPKGSLLYWKNLLWVFIVTYFCDSSSCTCICWYACIKPSLENFLPPVSDTKIF